MPGSRISSVVSTGSAGSRFSKRYRTKSKQSSVDETLFASPAKPRQCETKEEGWLLEATAPVRNVVPCNSGLRSRTRKPNTIQVVTKDLIRNVILPTTDPSGLTVVLKAGYYARVKGAARVRGEEDIRAEYEIAKKEKEEALKASRARKEEMRHWDNVRRQNKKLNDLEEEAKAQTEYLVHKANAQRLEQEDEVKHMNEIILNAKCHAIRDAQIFEKAQIKENLEEEERRLDAMMEIDRINSIKTLEKVDDLKKQQSYAGAAQIMKQIEQNAQDRMIEQEKKDQESMQMLKYLEKLKVEDLRALERKREEQQKMQKEIDDINQEQQMRKEFRKRQEELASQKVLNYMKQKADREAEYDAEQLRIRKEKEKDIARLLALQERARDRLAEQDALRAKRNQEEGERNWRRREREEAMKKSAIEGMVRAAHSQQIQSKEHFMAVQAQRERTEFERVLREQQRQLEESNRTEEDARTKRMQHSDDVRRQIREKEQARLQDRKDFFEEGIKLEEEARQRRARLDAEKKNKLETLREAGIPEKYCAEVERSVFASRNRLVY